MEKLLQRINRIDQKTMTIAVVALFIISSVLRSFYACYPKSIQVFPDEIRYIDIARSLFTGSGILVHHIHLNFDQILYPLFLAPFGFIKDQILQINAIAVGNSILVSSVIFPVYLLARRIINNKAVSLLLILTVLVLPDLAMSATFMSENLFYPLSAWLIYFVYQFWESEKKRDIILYCVLSALFAFFAYLTKVVAVYFIIAFMLSLLFDCLFTHKNLRRQNIRYGALFLAIAAGAIVGYKLLLLLSLGQGVATYNGNLRQSIYDFKTLIYFFYANIFNGVFALLAFFYFPVVIPLFRFRRFSKSERNLLVFALVSLIVMILIITLSISLNEDFPKQYMRQHTRYYAPLLILFLTLFFKQLFTRGDGAEKDRQKAKARLLAFTVFFAMAVFSVFKFFANVCIDGVLLQALSSLFSKYAKIGGDPDVFTASWRLILLKSLVVLLIGVFTVLLLKQKTKKAAARIFVVLIIAVSLGNNYFAMKEFSTIYGKAPELISQAISVNQFIDQTGGRVLIITSGYNPVLDTYFTAPAYWTRKNDAVKLLKDRQYIDLGEQKVTCNYPFTPYPDLSGVDYIITDKSVGVDEKYNVKIEIQGLDKYNVYKNQDPARLYLHN